MTFLFLQFQKEFMIRKYLFGLLLLGFIGCGTTKRQIQLQKRKIEVKDLQKDIDFVEKKLKKMHPDLYWYITEEAFDNKFDSLRSVVTYPMTANEFYLKLSPVLASVRQAHMGISPMQPVADVTKEQKKRYKNSKGPFSQFGFYWENRKLYISKDNTTDKRLHIGSEIVEINGVAPVKIYEKYRPCITSDGYNETFIDKRFNRNLQSFFNIEFGILDSLHLKVKCSDSISQVKLYRIFKDQEVKKVAIDKTEKKAIIPDSIKKIEKDKRLYGYDELKKNLSKKLSYPIKNDSSVALLRIRDFSNGKITKSYQQIFSELKNNNVQTLILDLRGNLGGRIKDVEELYSYLTKEEQYVFTKPAHVTSSFKLPFYVAKGNSIAHYALFSLFYIPQTVYLWSKTYKQGDKDFYKIDASKLKKRKENAFSGKLFVLIDGNTFSASSIISSNLKGSKRAIFVGEETGGAYNGTVAGRMPRLTLPNSKLKWVMGVMTIKPDYQSEIEGRGVFPDKEIVPTVEQVIAEEDVVKDWVLKNINYPN